MRKKVRSILYQQRPLVKSYKFVVRYTGMETLKKVLVKKILGNKSPETEPNDTLMSGTFFRDGSSHGKFEVKISSERGIILEIFDKVHVEHYPALRRSQEGIIPVVTVDNSGNLLSQARGSKVPVEYFDSLRLGLAALVYNQALLPSGKSGKKVVEFRFDLQEGLSLDRDLAYRWLKKPDQSRKVQDPVYYQLKESRAIRWGNIVKGAIESIHSAKHSAKDHEQLIVSLYSILNKFAPRKEVPEDAITRVGDYPDNDFRSLAKFSVLALLHMNGIHLRRF